MEKSNTCLPVILPEFIRTELLKDDNNKICQMCQTEPCCAFYQFFKMDTVRKSNMFPVGFNCALHMATLSGTFNCVAKYFSTYEMNDIIDKKKDIILKTDERLFNLFIVVKQCDYDKKIEQQKRKDEDRNKIRDEAKKTKKN